MIIYFADRKMNILGYATTVLKSGYMIVDDKKTEDVDTGIAVFECRVSWASKDRAKLEQMMNAGNYILRSDEGKKEFYTIIEVEISTASKSIFVYAEDAGMDLLNEVVGSYTADKAYPVDFYVEKFSKDSGFEIGLNEISNLTRKLSWDGEATCTERIASVATQFDHAEISYSFETKGLIITHKYINIHKKRGKDMGEQLRLGDEINSITINKSVANLATALMVTGGVPDGKEKPITLQGYIYDDGDFYVSGTRLNSRKALEEWSRYVWDKEPGKIEGYTGHIVRTYNYDTTDQKTLCTHAVTELKKLCQMEVNYDIDISRLPDHVWVGDRVNIIDDESGLYLSTRILKLETSVTNRKKEGTLGEYLIKSSGISAKIEALAGQFAKNAKTAEKALSVANLSVRQVDIMYALGDSSETAPTEGWQGTAPERESDKYIWQKTVTTYSDGGILESAPVCIQGANGEDAVLLQILSSNGNMFENSALSTTLTVEIIVGGLRITSSRDMYLYFGSDAQIEWQQKKYGETAFSPIDSTDSRISDNGFIFTINTEDVKLQTVYNCILNY